MFKNPNTPRDEEYLNEFKQKVADQRKDYISERSQILEKSRNGFIGTLAGIILAAIVGWLVLAPRFSNTGPEDIPVIRRPVTPAKIQPNEPGGLEIPDQDKSVYNLVEKKETVAAEVESLLPLPETPKMPEIVPEPEIIPEPEVRQPDPTETAGAPVATEEKLPVKQLDELIEEVQTTGQQKIKIPPKPAEIKVEPQTVTAEPSAPAAKQEQPAPKAEAIKATTAPTQTASSGTWQIQLMASSNKSAIEKSWKTLSGKFGALKNLPHEIEAVKSGNNTIYRLKAGAFENHEPADKICTQIKQKGGNCLVKQK